MRRALALFLLCLVVWQTSWAAASSYAGHVGAAGAAHEAHHQVNNALDKADIKAGLKADVKADVDCHICHACGLGLFATVGLTSTDLPSHFVRPPPEILPPSATPDEPDRPNWRATA